MGKVVVVGGFCGVVVCLGCRFGCLGCIGWGVGGFVFCVEVVFVYVIRNRNLISCILLF